MFPGEVSSWDTAVQKVVVSVLKRQYSSLNLDASKALSKLKMSGVHTVTTGHQLQLFGGPAFLHYKTISAIRKALLLEKESGSPVVPVFWMATEDHDFVEISWVWGREKKFNWEYPDVVKGKPVGSLSLNGLRGVAEDWLLDAGLSKEDESVILNCLKMSEGAGESYSQFFQRLMHAWYGDTGLIVIDAADAELKELAGDLLKGELKGDGIASDVRATSEKIESQGGKAQAHIREISLFHMPEGAPRVGIVSSEMHSETPAAELSPSVLLRPLYQEFLLPNQIVVLGPGEASYWQQLDGAFQKKGITKPELHLRDHCLWLSERNKGMVVWPKVEELKAQYVEKVTRERFAEQIAALEKLVGDMDGVMGEVVVGLDKSLEGAKGAAVAGMNKAVQAFLKKAKRAVKRSLEVELVDIERAAMEIVRDGNPQDRWANLHVLSASNGGFINSVGKLLDIQGNIEPVMIVFDEGS